MKQDEAKIKGLNSKSVQKVGFIGEFPGAKVESFHFLGLTVPFHSTSHTVSSPI
jgi:hypothetical protein